MTRQETIQNKRVRDRMKIITNSHLYPLLQHHELTAKEQEEHSEDDYGTWYVRYKGIVYALSEFTVQGAPDGWHGAFPTCYFHAVLIRIHEDGEHVTLASAYS